MPGLPFHRDGRSLSADELEFLVYLSFAESELRGLYARLGLAPPGFRAAKVGYQDMLADVTDEALRDAEVADAVARALDDASADVRREIADLPSAKLARGFPGVEALDRDGRLGWMLWALWRDPRPEAMQRFDAHLKEGVPYVDRVDAESTASKSDERAETVPDDPLAPAFRELRTAVDRFERDLWRATKEIREQGDRAAAAEKKDAGAREALAEARRKNADLESALASARRDAEAARREAVASTPAPERSEAERDAARLRRELEKSSWELDRARERIERLEAERGREVADESARERLAGDLSASRGQIASLEERLAEAKSRHEVEVEHLQKAVAAAERRSRGEGDVARPRLPRVGLFVNTSALYYLLRDRHTGARLDYRRLCEFMARGRSSELRIAYTEEPPGPTRERFFRILRELGFQIRHPARPRDAAALGVLLGEDLARAAGRIEIAALAPSSWLPPVELAGARSRGLQVEIFALPSEESPAPLMDAADEVYILDRQVIQAHALT